jgi:hypothetical protein
VVVRDLCRGEEIGVNIFTRFFMVYELWAGECSVRCPRVEVDGPFMLGYPVAFEPSGFISVVVVERVRTVFRRDHVTLLVRTGGLARVGGRCGAGRGWEGDGGDVLTRLLDVTVEPYGFVLCVVGLRVVFRVVGLCVAFGLVYELFVLISLVSEPERLVYPSLVLVFELPELVCYLLVSLDFSFIPYFPVFSRSVVVMIELLEFLCLVFRLSVPVFELPGCVLVFVVVRFGVVRVRLVLVVFVAVVTVIGVFRVLVVVGHGVCAGL